MPAIRVVDRIQDQEDFSGVPTDGQILQYQSSSNKFVPVTFRFTFQQSVAASIWNINHNMNCYPVVTVVDSGGNVQIGAVQYIDQNNIQIAFNATFGGIAYLT